MSTIHPNPTAEPLLKPDSKPISLSFPNPSGKPGHEGTIAVITLDAPMQLNAMRLQDTHQLIDTLQWIAAQHKILFTVLTGNGRFFSAGADFNDVSRDLPEESRNLPQGSAEHVMAQKLHTLTRMGSSNVVLTEILHRHPKILVGAMNGPAVGLYATMLAHCDLLYTYPDFWLNVPFMSLALVSEGGAALAFARKMGLGRAQVALLEGKKMEADELRQAGFIAHIFPAHSKPSNMSKDQAKRYTAPILSTVLSHLTDKFLPPVLDPFSLLFTKELLRAAAYDGWDMAKMSIEEFKGAEAVFTSGRPQKQFERIRDGGRHKL